MAIRPTSNRSFFHVPVAFHPLTEKYFGTLWAGAFLSNVGFWIQNVAQGWQVLQLTDSALLLGLVTFIATIPNLLFTIFGGVIADKFERRRLLIISQSVYMATAILPGVLTSLGIITVWHIILIALVNGIFSAVGFPAWQAFIGDLVPAGELKQGIALNSMQFNLSRVVGPAIGGLSIGIFGIAGSYYLNGISYIAVIVPLLMMHPPQRLSPRAERQNIWHTMAEGLIYLKKRPMLQVLLGLQFMVAFFVFPYTTLLPVFAGNIFHTGPTGLGIMNAVAGIGALLGAILLVIFADRLRKGSLMLLVLCAVGGLASIFFAWMPAQQYALPMLVVLGASTVMANTTTNTTLQSSTPEAIRGRILSIWITITFGIAPFGNLLSGTLAQSYGAQPTMILSGALCILVAAGLVLATRGSFRQPVSSPQHG
jgi:MFS family permease